MWEFNVGSVVPDEACTELRAKPPSLEGSLTAVDEELEEDVGTAAVPVCAGCCCCTNAEDEEMEAPGRFDAPWEALHDEEGGLVTCAVKPT